MTNTKSITHLTFTIADIYGTSLPMIPAGYEQSDFAVPKVGDKYLSKSGGTIKTMSASARAQLPKIIVKPAPVYRTVRFKVVGTNRVPIWSRGEFGYNPATDQLSQTSSSLWPEVVVKV